MAAETRTFEELAAAGWSEADLDWENAADDAIEHLAAGRIDEARTRMAHGVQIATASFGASDPRLGASLANHAAATVAAGEAHLAGRTLADARQAWRGCDAWIAKMTAPRVARSSMFHMRMEQRHRPAYEARWRVKWAELVEAARERVGTDGPLTLVSQAEASERLARWRRERPAMLNDTRKLMGAVLLLACRQPP